MRMFDFANLWQQAKGELAKYPLDRHLNPDHWEKLWPDYQGRWLAKMMGEAFAPSAFSTCLARHTGAALVKVREQHNHNMAPFTVTSCFNGAPTGNTPCTVLGYCYYRRQAKEAFRKRYKIIEAIPPDSQKSFDKFREGYRHLCRAVHAEANAIYFYNGDTTDAILFCTTNPCPDCTKLIAQKQIAVVYYAIPYKSDDQGRPQVTAASQLILKEAGNPLIQLSFPLVYFNWLGQELHRAGINVYGQNKS